SGVWRGDWMIGSMLDARCSMLDGSRVWASATAGVRWAHGAGITEGTCSPPPHHITVHPGTMDP
ncbi:hypothetical protein, partial [Streptomyces sp. Agncl-13]|uniref:hypothetical protein n=1 Tax=Streptomyces sp. Agncl-13 TaxID=3400628 RepID=UPI003A88EF83